MAEDIDAIAEAVAARLAAQPADRPLYSPRTLAARLEVSERTVRQMLADGVIDSFKVGEARRVSAEAVDRYIALREDAERPRGE